MPLVRYFLFTGAMLLSLLFAADWYLPKTADKIAADVDRSAIRIHSDHQWPVAVRIDASVPMPRIMSPTVVADEVPLPAPIREPRAYLPAMSPRLSDKPQRRAKHRVSRLSTREIHRHVAYQLNSFSDHLVAARTAVLAEKRVASTAIPADVYSLNRCHNG